MILNKQVHLIHLISIKHPKNNLFSIKLKFAVFLDSYLLCIILANSNFVFLHFWQTEENEFIIIMLDEIIVLIVSHCPDVEILFCSIVSFLFNVFFFRRQDTKKTELGRN